MRRAYLFKRADDIAFEYQLSEFGLITKIRKPCETGENKNNWYVAEWLRNVGNANLVRIQSEVVYFFLFPTLFFIAFCQSFFGIQLEVPSRDL